MLCYEQVLSTMSNWNESYDLTRCFIVFVIQKGTSYTISNTEQMSGATTASNYARDWGRCVGVRPELNDQGPFLHFPDMSVPPYVLTKTHCTAYCDDCSPSRYVMSNTTAFEEGCLSGSKKDGEVVTDTTYSVTVPVKAVHLIRSPFDNIVSRMHLGVKRRRRQGWNEEDLAKFMNGKDGFHTWCRYIEDKYVKQETSTSRIDEETKRLFEGVPCHADIFRYVQWHNLAIQVLEKQDIPVHVLHYESYSTDYNATVDRLFEFLELEKKHKPLPFVAGKTYLSYYSDEEARRTSKLVRAVASPATWALVKHYFEPWNPHT